MKRRKMRECNPGNRAARESTAMRINIKIRPIAESFEHHDPVSGRSLIIIYPFAVVWYLSTR